LGHFDRADDARGPLAVSTGRGQQLLALAVPVVLEQGRQAQDDDVEETANDGAQNEHPSVQEGGLAKIMSSMAGDGKQIR
jgi:hypothetical protein